MSAVCLLVLATGCTPSGRGEKQKVYQFWPPEPSPPRIQYLTSYSVSNDVIGKSTRLDELIYGKEVAPVLLINKPYGVEMRDGKIYVCDTKNAAVIILDIRAREVRLMGTIGADKLTKPVDIAIADDGMKYVADASSGKVYVFGANDHFVRTIGDKGRPVGLAVWGDRLYVCNFKTSQVDVFNRLTGETLLSIGAPGRGKGQLAGPIGIAADDKGNIYVSDVLGCRVQKFDPEGKFLLSFGSRGDKHGSFTRPKHVAVDEEGIVYVVDAAFQNVQMFDSEGRLLMSFGTAGGHPGAMELPAGICVYQGDIDLFKKYMHPAFKAERLIVVTNQFGLNKVSVYALGQLRPGMTIDRGSSKSTSQPAGKDKPSSIFAGIPTTMPSRPDDEPPATAPATAPATMPAALEPSQSGEPAKEP